MPSLLATLARTAGTMLLATVVLAQERRGPDPLAFFRPVVSLADAEQAKLDGGASVVKLLPHSGRDLAIFAAVPSGVSGERLAGWVRQIADLKRSEFVEAIHRFSDPPRIDDLASLTLDADDLDAIRRCRPRSCGVKLSEPEIASLTQLAAGAGDDWRSAVQDGFRRAVLARVEAYLASGFKATPPYADQRTPVMLDEEFVLLQDQFPFLSARLPRLADHLRQYPGAPPPGIESFLYWSKETLGGKPIVIVTHVFIVTDSVPDVPEAVVLSRQVYANHYMTGSLAITAISGTREGATGYLMYLNRSRIDVLGGLFGPVTRLIIERRLRGEAAEVVDGLRMRIEAGLPPG